MMSAYIKRLLVLILFVTVGLGATAQSSAIKTGPVGFAFGYFSGCYEKALSDHTSFQISVNPYNKVRDYDGVAYGASIEFRLYITKKEVLNGFYISPRIGATFGNLTNTDTSEENDASAFQFIANLGYQWIWSNGFLVDISFGPKYSLGQGDNTAPDFDGFHPDVNFAIGYAF